MMGCWQSNSSDRRKLRSARPNLALEALEDRMLLNAGSLDLSFGIGGKSVTPGIGQAFDATLHNSQIIAVGGVNGDFVVARYNSGGSADTTFGTNGVVTTNLGSTQDQAEGVAVQSDNKIVVAGFTQSATTGRDFALVRYNANGTLDTSFGTGGIVTTDFNGLDDQAGDVLLQPDGKIVVIGTAMVAGGNTEFAVARYNTNGSLDTGFGTGGKVTTSVGQFDTGNRAVLQSDGKIILAGGSGFTLVRYNPNGSLDTSFGTGGIVSVLPDSLAEDLALRPDGRIVVGGILTNGTSNTDFQAAQFLQNGALDTSFATSGIVTTFFTGFDATAFSLALQSDGSLILGGSVSSNNTLADDWALTRYTAAGSPDFSFGLNGKVITDLGSDIEEIHSLLLPADGQLLAVGLTGSGFGLARYQAQAPHPIDTSANALYVDQLFLQLLGRQADDAGRGYFTSLLDAGNGNRFLTPAQQQLVARRQVVQIIQGTLEYRTDVVQSLYQGILGRAADAGGLNAWVAFLGIGGTQFQVESELMGSVEFVNANGGTASSFVNAVYGKVLGRSLDSSGSFWVDQLNAGASTQGVVMGILRSAESATLTTGDLFAAFLNRQPDSVGLAAYVNAIMGGVPTEYLTLFIVSSQEFYNNAQAT
jgi:uncharacterized delta-60 repeat protein